MEDDGAGEDPDGYAARSPATPRLDSVGLGNVDGRLRNAFGDDYGLVVETAPGAGTKVDRAGPEVRAGVARMKAAAPRAARCSWSTTSGPALDELAYLLAARRPDRRGAHQRLGDRGAADPARGRRRRGLPRHPDARPDRARAGPGAGPVPRARRRSCSSPPTSSTRSRPSTCAPSTTCSSRCAPTGWPRRYAGSSRRRRARSAGDDAQVAVERGGVTRFVNRSDITHVEAQGDYARLHTATDSHLVRTPLTTLEEEWAERRVRPDPPLAAGLARPRHRGADGRRPLHGRRRRPGARAAELGVSRRHTRELRELLLRRRGRS